MRRGNDNLLYFKVKITGDRWSFMKIEYPLYVPKGAQI